VQSLAKEGREGGKERTAQHTAAELIRAEKKREEESKAEKIRRQRYIVDQCREEGRRAKKICA
jgi:hypothetical protein